MARAQICGVGCVRRVCTPPPPHRPPKTPPAWCRSWGGGVNAPWTWEQKVLAILKRRGLRFSIILSPTRGAGRLNRGVCERECVYKHTYIHMYVYVFVCGCVCVCVCVCVYVSLPPSLLSLSLSLSLSLYLSLYLSLSLSVCVCVRVYHAYITHTHTHRRQQSYVLSLIKK
jgi:hypothetical protein